MVVSADSPSISDARAANATCAAPAAPRARPVVSTALAAALLQRRRQQELRRAALTARAALAGQRLQLEPIDLGRMRVVELQQTLDQVRQHLRPARAFARRAAAGRAAVLGQTERAPQ